MTDLTAFSLTWHRSSADDEVVALNYRHPDRTGNGPDDYPFRDDATLTYTTGDGESHTAELAVDPNDTSAGPWGLYSFSGPHAEAAELDGERCHPYFFALTQVDDHRRARIGVPAACFGDLAAVTGVALTHVTRHGGDRAVDRAAIATSAHPPAPAAWRKRVVKDPRGDAGYSVSGQSRFADVTRLATRYDPDAQTLRTSVRFAALSTRRSQPRQRLTFYVDDADGASRQATAFVPGSGGRRGSFEVAGCSGESMSLERSTRTVTMMIPGSCVGAEVYTDVWVNTLRGRDIDTVDNVYDVLGVVLF
jgi:hypothetical protein